MELYDPDKFYDFTKHNENDKIWWTSIPERYGLHYFSFDRNNLYNLWEDYPDKLTSEEKNFSIRKTRSGQIFLGIQQMYKIM